jgi:putative endonuclease
MPEMRWLRRLLRPLLSRRPPSDLDPDFSEAELGGWGETQAARHLEGRGLRVLGRNWRHGRDELDLVVLDGEVLVFVEVKTRRGDEPGRGWFAVNARKRRALRRAARGWLRAVGGAPHVRFDVVEVLICHGGNPRIVHHIGAGPLWPRRR